MDIYDIMSTLLLMRGALVDIAASPRWGWFPTTHHPRATPRARMRLGSPRA